MAAVLTKFCRSKYAWFVPQLARRLNISVVYWTALTQTPARESLLFVFDAMLRNKHGQDAIKAWTNVSMHIL